MRCDLKICIFHVNGTAWYTMAIKWRRINSWLCIVKMTKKDENVCTIRNESEWQVIVKSAPWHSSAVNAMKWPVNVFLVFAWISNGQKMNVLNSHYNARLNYEGFRCMIYEYFFLVRICVIARAVTHFSIGRSIKYYACAFPN